MNRSEAEALLGKRVSAWTAMNGEYVGDLVEVLPVRPWRGRVRITGVLSPACAFEAGRPQRRGFRPGDEIVVGGVNIKKTSHEGWTYLAALEGERAKLGHTPWERNEWVRLKNIEAVEHAIAEERAGRWARSRPT